MTVADALEIGGVASGIGDAAQCNCLGTLGNVAETLRAGGGNGQSDCKQGCETKTHDFEMLCGGDECIFFGGVGMEKQLKLWNSLIGDGDSFTKNIVCLKGMNRSGGD